MALSIFGKHLQGAFTALVRSPEADHLLGLFCQAYDYRRRVEWSEEHGEDGLEQALARALMLYSYPSDPDHCRHRKRKVSDRFRADLATAMEQVVAHQPFAVTRFYSGLRGAGVDVANIDDEALAPHLAQAIQRYCENWDRGLSLSPW